VGFNREQETTPKQDVNKMGYSLKLARIAVLLAVIGTFFAGLCSKVLADAPSILPATSWTGGGDHGTTSGWWDYWNCTGSDGHSVSLSNWGNSNEFYNPRFYNTDGTGVNIYDVWTVTFSGSGSTSVIMRGGSAPTSSPPSHIRTNIADNYLANFLTGANPTYTAQGAMNLLRPYFSTYQSSSTQGVYNPYQRAVVAEMLISGTDSSYNFTGDPKESDSMPGNPQIIGLKFNRTENNTTTRSGDSTGKLYFYTTGTTTIGIETLFEGGYIFDRGSINLEHNYALGYFDKASKETTGRLWSSIVSGDPTMQLQEHDGSQTWDTTVGEYDLEKHDTWRQKIDGQGLVEVRGNDAGANDLVIGVTRLVNREIQNRFEVASGKTLTFATPYSAPSSGSTPDNHLLTIQKVDTRGYLDFEGQDLNGGAIYLKGQGADLSRVTWGTERPGELFFFENAAMRGGAIYAANNLSLGGNTRFEKKYCQ
jgi:predicted outer membrane repeat protein